MDKVILRGLEIFAYHGVNPEEKRDGQLFVLDITLFADLSQARKSDSLEDTVNYAAVRKTVQRAFTETKYNLIERAAQAVCDAVFAGFPQVEEITLRLKKPEAPMNAVFDYAAVEITQKEGGKSMKTVLGLGGNLGNREENLAMAVEELEKLPRTRLLAMSNLYETAPFDVASEQPDYLNCCVLAETRLSPEELLEQCLAIENRLGRVRTEYHGARTVDIDLLLFEGCRKDTERLTLPHPRMLERAFVLAPLSDLFPGRIAPPFQFDFSEAYQAVDKTGVRLYK